jgi:hypothetical protein
VRLGSRLDCLRTISLVRSIRGRRGRHVGHHRFSIILGASGEIQESTKDAGKKVPSDDTVKDKINRHLKDLDVGEGFKITKINVDTYTKEPIP